MAHRKNSEMLVRRDPGSGCSPESQAQHLYNQLPKALSSPHCTSGVTRGHREEEGGPPHG